MKSHQASVRKYYEDNTARFLRWGQGGVAGVMHRAVWGDGVSDRASALQYIHHLLMREMPGSSEARVLDLGCGTGAALRYVLERSPGAVGLGVTISRTQAEIARKASEASGLTQRLRVVEADFMKLPPMEPVDLVWAVESFLHAPSATAFFRQAAAQLRPGGKIAICDDFLGNRTPTTRREVLALQEFCRGWHVGVLETFATIDAIANSVGLRCVRELNLTKHLELRRPRDRLITWWIPVARRLGLRGKYFDSLSGGNALQSCLCRGLVQYRFGVWKKVEEIG